MNTFLYGVFVSPHNGLGGLPSFLACVSRHGMKFQMKMTIIIIIIIIIIFIQIQTTSKADLQIPQH
jgi:uncharacterized integral membrane protein